MLKPNLANHRYHSIHLWGLEKPFYFYWQYNRCYVEILLLPINWSEHLTIFPSLTHSLTHSYHDIPGSGHMTPPLGFHEGFVYWSQLESSESEPNICWAFCGKPLSSLYRKRSLTLQPRSCISRTYITPKRGNESSYKLNPILSRVPILTGGRRYWADSPSKNSPRSNLMLVAGYTFSAMITP